MTHLEVQSVVTVAEWAGLKAYLKDKPQVFGTDSEGQPRPEISGSELHVFLTFARSYQ